MKFSFHGKVWKYVRSKFNRKADWDGKCDAPDTAANDRLIQVCESLKGKRELDVNIHEMLHACCWYLDEKIVRKSATDIANALWQLGYRKTSDASEKRKEKNK